MGRKARHSARTGDGGAELRQRKKELAEAQRAQKDAELAFYDDPSEGESDAQQDGGSSDEDELEGDEVMELGEGDDDDDDDDDDGFDDGDDDDGFDGDAERKKARQMETQWGSSRKNFYSADTTHYEIDEDEEAAKDEEEAALELQRRQAALLDDEDFGFDEDATEGGEEEEEEEEEQQQESDKPAVDDEALVGEQLADIANLADDGAGGASSVEQVHKDFSKMTKKDKLQIVNQSAPELLGLMSELENATKELQEVVTPALLKLRPVRRKPRSLQLGLRYLATRQNLLLNYSANISFYLLLRAEGKSVADHPVLLHLLLLKKQLNKMQALDEVLGEQLQELLTKDVPEPEERQRLDDGLDQFFSKTAKQSKSNGKRNAAQSASANKKAKHSKQQATSVSTAEQAEAEQFYETMAREQAALKQSKKELYSHENPALASSEDDSEAEDGSGKRGASYQMIKNKGLKAHKSKLNRNPRVKKRMQFRKAVIRRKGQVRDVRTGEAGKYGGETTGIKSNLSRSRKIRN